MAQTRELASVGTSDDSPGIRLQSRRSQPPTRLAPDDAHPCGYNQLLHLSRTAKKNETSRSE